MELLASIAATLLAFTGTDLDPRPPLAPPRVDYERDVRPILEASCIGCHGERRQESGLRLDRAESARFGGDSGRAAIVPGDAAASELARRIAGTDDDVVMPPPSGGRSRALDADEVELLRRWIDEGADWPASASRESEDEGSRHWAYVPPARPVPPRVESPDWCRNPIDRFVLARLEAKGLEPSPGADRVTLIRRVSLDLTGLPPTPREVDAFLSDPARDAYERVVDRLLASPHYGERWARHWMDLARYADSHGFTVDGARSMWPWRDWVVDAFNQDLPFDRFTELQLAGDLLPDASLSDRVATGFHRNTLINQEGGADDEEFRVAAVKDRVDTTASVWLGSTLACAQCHSHKFDPFTQRDYYRMYAVFDQTADRGVSTGPQIEVPSPDEQREIERIDAERARLRKRLDRSTPDLEAAQAEWERETLARNDQWRVPEDLELVGTGDARFERLADGSWRGVGPGPERSTYTFRVAGPPADVTALRLEVFADDAFPQRGPGRAKNGNFVLNRFLAFAVGADGERRPLSVASAHADHSQHLSHASHWPVENVLDGDDRTGWAILPKTGSFHVAVLPLAAPLRTADGESLEVDLVQHYGSRHTIGRLRLSLTERPGPDAKSSVTASRLLALMRTPPPKRRAAERDELARHYRSIAPALDATRAAVHALNDARPRPPKTLVMQIASEPRETRMLLRGSFLDPGPAVEPGVPSVLAGDDDVVATRLDLARWLVAPGNPLTHRVLVNRAWQRFFGLGIVLTENDFGTRGAPPTHPELLDWLAREFVERGQSMKALHRTIVTSATYRQASRPRAPLTELDPRNRWLGRQSRLRCDAETLRDSALVASGLLCATRGGAPVHPPQPSDVFAFTQTKKRWTASEGEDRYRRTLYTWIWRTSPHPFLTTFDFAQTTVACTRRNRSNTPLQALTMANDPMMIELAQGLAVRALALESSDDRARLVAAFRWCLVRAPEPAELARLERFLDSQLQSFRAAPGDAELAVPLARRSGAPAEQAAAWTATARVLLNLDEFATRE